MRGRFTCWAVAALAAATLATGLAGCTPGRGAGPTESPSADQSSAVVRDDLRLVEEGDGYAAYVLPFGTDGQRIYGRLYLPDGADEKTPLVVVSHGFASSWTATARDAERLAAAGAACYVFDFRGGSPSGASDGSMLDMSVETEAVDLELVMDSLLEQGLVEPDRLFLMGESQGGLVSALAAARRPADVAGLVLVYPAFSIPDDARARFSSVDEIPEGEVEGLFGVTVGRRYYADILGLDPFAEIGAYEGPVLIAHGDADAVVPLAYSERAAEAYANAELHVLPGAGHGFSDDELDDVCGWASELISGAVAES